MLLGSFEAKFIFSFILISIASTEKTSVINRNILESFKNTNLDEPNTIEDYETLLTDDLSLVNENLMSILEDLDRVNSEKFRRGILGLSKASGKPVTSNGLYFSTLRGSQLNKLVQLLKEYLLQNEFNDMLGSDDYSILPSREIRKKLPITRLKRLEGENSGRVSRDSLPVIRLKKRAGQLEGIRGLPTFASSERINNFDNSDRQIWHHRSPTSAHIIPMISPKD